MCLGGANTILGFTTDGEGNAGMRREKTNERGRRKQTEMEGIEKGRRRRGERKEGEGVIGIGRKEVE